MGRCDGLRPRDPRSPARWIPRHRVRQPASRSCGRLELPHRVPAYADRSDRARRALLRGQCHLDRRDRQRPGQGTRLSQRMDVRRGREPAGAPGAVRRQPCGPSIRPVAFTSADGSEGADLSLDPEAFREAFAADVDQATADVMAAAQRPYAAAAFAGAPSGAPAGKTLPCWYLLGTEDKAIPPALQRFMAERANATIVEVPASHVSFVSQPDAATQLILQAVEATISAASRT